MDTTGLPELWHSALAIVAHQAPFVAILLVTFAALFVVMALEGFRSSLRAMWHSHRAATPTVPRAFEEPSTLAAPVAFAPPTRGFAARPRASRPIAPDLTPRRFRSPRPKIRRQTAYAASTTPAGNAP